MRDPLLLLCEDMMLLHQIDIGVEMTEVHRVDTEEEAAGVDMVEEDEEEVEAEDNKEEIVHLGHLHPKELFRWKNESSNSHFGMSDHHNSKVSVEWRQK